MKILLYLFGRRPNKRRSEQELTADADRAAEAIHRLDLLKQELRVIKGRYR